MCEIFYSIQGEGVNIGKPSVFVRLAMCNLRCEWCDTLYAVLPRYKNRWVEMKEDEVVRSIKKYNSNHVVWTGGEPTLQIDEVEKVIRKLKNYTHEIETNGTLWFNTSLFKNVNISPKKQAINSELLKKFNECENVYFKFVIEDEENLKFWLRLIERVGLDRKKCIFMPEGKGRRSILKKSLWLIERCKECNIRFSPRLQVMLYGWKEGV